MADSPSHSQLFHPTAWRESGLFVSGVRGGAVEAGTLWVLVTTIPPGDPLITPPFCLHHTFNVSAWGGAAWGTPGTNNRRRASSCTP